MAIATLPSRILAVLVSDHRIQANITQKNSSVSKMQIFPDDITGGVREVGRVQASGTNGIAYLLRYVLQFKKIRLKKLVVYVASREAH